MRKTFKQNMNININDEKAIMLTIKKIMKENKVTQKKVSKITGLYEANISNMFNGKFSPTLTMLVAVLNASNIRLTFTSVSKI